MRGFIRRLGAVGISWGWAYLYLIVTNTEPTLGIALLYIGAGIIIISLTYRKN